MPSFDSDPQNDGLRWRSIFHPLLGICHHFELAEDLKSVMGMTNLEFVNIHLKIENAYGSRRRKKRHLPKKEQKAKILTTFDEVEEFQDEECEEIKDFIEEPEREDRKVMILVYHQGSLLLSKQVLAIDEDESSYFTVEQEIIDKSHVKNECETDQNYVEDFCLNQCLVSRSVQELGCLHARLFSLANETMKKSAKICNYGDFLKPTKAQLLTRRRSLKRLKLNCSMPYEKLQESGLVKIRDILSDFYTQNLELRCGCPVPCKRKEIRIAKWPLTGRLRRKNGKKIVMFHVSTSQSIFKALTKIQILQFPQSFLNFNLEISESFKTNSHSVKFIHISFYDEKSCKNIVNYQNVVKKAQHQSKSFLNLKNSQILHENKDSKVNFSSLGIE